MTNLQPKNRRKFADLDSIYALCPSAGIFALALAICSFAIGERAWCESSFLRATSSQALDLTLIHTSIYASFLLAIFLFIVIIGLVLRERLLLLYSLTVLTLQLFAVLALPIPSTPVVLVVHALTLLSISFFLREWKQHQNTQLSQVLRRNGGLVLISSFGAIWISILLLATGVITSGPAKLLIEFLAAMQTLGMSAALLVRVLNLRQIRAETSYQEALVVERSAIIRQVSHDIRSPLSALSMVVGTLSELPESRRLLIRNATQRINDITNDLSKREKAAPLIGNSNTVASVESEPQMVVSLIDSIVSEKRLQYREKMHIEIQGDLEGGYGLFVQIHPGDFSRALSHLIDNSIHAVGDSGMITISVVGHGGQVKISVRDNGCGISPEMLTQLGAASLSKVNPLHDEDPGVQRANAVFAKAGGSMSFSSELTHGALVEIVLPRAKTPFWFVKLLELRESTIVISVDDDQTIHQIWKGRFASAETAARGVAHLTFSSVELFEQWVAAHHQPSLVYLIDYEFLGQDRNGLEVIEKLNLESQAILVTSRYEEPQIRQRAERLGVRILPKSLAPMIPIAVAPAGEKLDAVLIDDDSLVHMSWQMAARAAGRKLRVFATANEFEIAAFAIDPATPLYIDVNLAAGIRGQDVASRAAQLGFTKIYLATGYTAEDVARPPCVSGVIGKDPVF